VAEAEVGEGRCRPRQEKKPVSGTTAWVRDAGDDCGYWGGKLARRRRVQVRASESCPTFGQRSALVHR
jgi:hypothetical protein